MVFFVGLGFVRHTPVIVFDNWYQLVILIFCLIYFQFRAVEVGKITLSLSLSIYLPIIFVYGIGEAMWISCLITIIHSLAIGKRWNRIFLNSVQRSLSALLAGQVFLLLGGQIGVFNMPGSLVPIIIASLTYNIVNLGSVIILSILMGAINKVKAVEFLRSNIHAWYSTLLFAYTGILLSIFIATWQTHGLLLFVVLMLGFSETMQHGTKLNVEQQLRMKAEKELVLDSKTKVYNYRYLRKWLDRSENLQPLAVLFIDIDDFKIFNDRYGHEQGDLALKNVATVIAKGVRNVDRVIRFGGEEFVVLLPGMKGDQALEVANRIQKKLTTIPEASKEYPVTVSIGVAAYPDDAKDMHELLRVADIAMYQAKISGKNQSCVFCPDIQTIGESV